MPLAQVRDFVCKYCSELVLGLRLMHQTVVNTHDATRNCEGIDCRVVDHNQLKLTVSKVAMKHQLENEILDVIVEKRVIEDRRLSAKNL